MGIGVLDMIEMYANSVCDTQTMLPKEPVERPHSGVRRLKRRISTVSEDSGRPRSPWSTRSSNSSLRSHRTSKLNSSTSSSTENTSNRFTITSNTYAGTTDTDDEEIVKRSRLEGASTSTSSSSSMGKMRESYDSRRKRFLRTAEALRHSGLLDITMKTAELLRKNQDLQKEIENLQKETKTFVISVLTNPENRPILDNIRSQAQLYEVIVPGSQGIMSVSSSSLPEHGISREHSLSSEEEDSSASNDTGNVSSPSPAPTESDGTSSLSEDSDSSEKENLTPLKGTSSYKQ